MYAFEARLPIDHVLAAVRLIRSGSLENGKLLKLIGASVGEVGALLEKGPIFSLSAPEGTSVEDAIAALEAVEFSSAEAAEPNFDITPFIPYILMVIEWLIKRRRS